MNSDQLQLLQLRLNGAPVEVEIDPRSLLVEVIRHCGAKGCRIGCLTGDCGACSAELDGRLVKSCLILAVSASGCEIVTIEGYQGEIASALRSAFKEHRGFQCGYCTSGMIMVANDLLKEKSVPTDAEIRQSISGNLCRCTGYDDIVKAIAEAASHIDKNQ